MVDPTEKLIRQLSLIAYLISARRPVTASEIRRDVEGYSEMSEDAFPRRFYADRAELEAVGIVLGVEKPEDGEPAHEKYSLPRELRSPINELLIDLLERIRRRVSLCDVDVAVATGTSDGAVADWVSRRAAPNDAQAALLGQLLATVELLQLRIEPDAVRSWLRRSVSALDGRTPLEILAAGGYPAIAGFARDLTDPHRT